MLVLQNDEYDFKLRYSLSLFFLNIFSYELIFFANADFRFAFKRKKNARSQSSWIFFVV